jgi:hypothetical protein
VETSHDPDLRVDLVGRLKRTTPPPAVAAVALTRTGRSRLAGSDVASETDDSTAGEVDLAALGDSDVDPISSTARRDAARPDLAGLGDRLLADARDACRREAVPATRREVLMRVAQRVGVPPAEAARGLRGTLRPAGVVAAAARPSARHLRDRVLRLAATILGERERAVFMARRGARPDDMAALHELAASLGLSVERVYELEASARRKLATALGQPPGARGFGAQVTAVAAAKSGCV